jgi:hypothetical protein
MMANATSAVWSRTNDTSTKVKRPWPENSPEFLCWSPICGGGLTQELDEKKIDKLRNAMAVDGIQTTRDFGWWCVNAADPTYGKYLLPWKPDWSWDEEYWARLDRRIKQWAKRNGTYVISILDACSFYAGDSFETNPFKSLLGDRPQDIFRAGPARDLVFEYARELVHRSEKFRPRVIFQTRNEGGQVVGPDVLYDYDHALIALLKSEGIPPRNIMIGYYDSSYCAMTLLPETWTDPKSGVTYHGVDLMGEGLADAHNIGSPEKIENSGDDALRDISWGAFPSCDGPDDKSEGLGWFWLPFGVNRRPTPAQTKRIVVVMKGFGKKRFEWWSSVAFQKSVEPNLDDAITNGHEERLAMSGA